MRAVIERVRFRPHTSRSCDTSRGLLVAVNLRQRVVEQWKREVTWAANRKTL